LHIYPRKLELCLSESNRVVPSLSMKVKQKQTKSNKQNNYRKSHKVAVS